MSIRIPYLVRRVSRTCVVAVVVAGSLSTAGVGTANAGIRMDARALETAHSTLSSRLVPNTSVGLDPKTNQVVLTIADAASGTGDLVAAAHRLGPAVRVNHVRGGFDTLVAHVRGGNGIIDANGSGTTCSLGFNLAGGLALTAGHCTRAVARWNKENNGELIGPSLRSNFPIQDFGLIRNDGGLTQFPDITRYDNPPLAITGFTNPVVGQIVCKSGIATHYTCGQVTATNVTVSFRDGTVMGLIETNLCAQPGDSGGPLIIANLALGLTSGGSVNIPCTDPQFHSYYQPVFEALSTYGVTLLR